MAQAVEAGAIQCAAPAWYRAAVYQSAEFGKAQGYFCLCRLRLACVRLGHEIRKRHRLAELLSTASQRSRNVRGPFAPDAADRSALPPLRRSSWSPIRRRTAPRRPALL